MNALVFAVHELAPDHAVVELHESLTAPFGGLELHIALPAGQAGSIAWWMNDWGTVVLRVPVGRS